MAAMISLKRPGLQRQSGQELVEFALVVPFLVLLLFGIFELGRVFMTYNTLANAAREGARYAIAHPGNETGDCGGPAGSIVTNACRLTGGLTGSGVAITSTLTVETVTVQAGYTVELMAQPVIEALNIGSSIRLTASSTMQREQ